jgi:NADH-quinone oxidoreductase subunit G
MADLVNIEINGVTLQVPQGSMLIEAADEAGIVIPRFCYHKKLSVAANCRMCLVEVEKAPKPLPACATPVTEGMKVFTQSPKALEAQRSVMEFLLINHPLDCPICDQGGECDLQDIAMGFGRDISRFAENKRVVRDKNLGPLISTDMTRCIHCTRCVRFGQEIGGIMELGAPGRGEHMEISTYMESAVDSEMSGNVIDLCPVGALTSKPYRYRSRPWENAALDGIAPHDCIGSNVHVEVRRNKVMRVLPKENEAINEVWLSDRDRFSYTGIYSEDRLTNPMIKQGERWQEVEWETALKYAVEGIKRVVDAHGAQRIGALAAPGSTLEEFYLLQKLMRELGSSNVDHRLRQSDFSDQDIAPAFPYLGQSVADLENLDAALLIGSYVRKDQPIAGHRLRKAAKRGARIMAINPVDYDFNFELSERVICSPAAMSAELAGVARALLEQGSDNSIAQDVQSFIADAEVTDTHRAIAKNLREADQATVLLGAQAMLQDNLSALRALANVVSQLADARIGYMPEGANAAGAWLAGMVPHRGPAGRAVEPGLNAAQMLENGLNGFVLLNVEPEHDSANPAAASEAVRDADFVVCLSSYVTEAMRDYADVLLPVSLFAETAGTYVNVEGKWQSFTGSVKATEEARPAWKVLRVLGNFFQLNGFEYLSSEEVRDELDSQTEEQVPSAASDWRRPETASGAGGDLKRIGFLPIYATDALVRRAGPLQQTHDALPAVALIHPVTARRLGIEQPGQQVRVSQNGASCALPIYMEEAIAEDCVFLPTAIAGVETLGPAYGDIEVKAE